MKEKLSTIIQTFPDFEVTVKWLFENDATFQDLCMDYIICASKLLDLKMEYDKSESQVKEYEDLQLSLEEEMLNLILKRRKGKKPD